MRLQIRQDRMEEVEGLRNEYPYAYHHVDLRRTLIPWHWHEALEFNYVLEGAVRVSTAANTQCFQRNEAFFINSNVLTTMVHDGGCVMDSHLFHPIFLGGHFKSVFETRYLNPVLQDRRVEVIGIRGETEAQRRLLGKLRQLSRLQERPDVEFETRNLLSEIWLCLLDVLRERTADLQDTVSRNQDRILTMLAFFHENYGEKLTLRDVADAAAISERECLRCFRATIHQSPMEYLNDYRIRMARKLLETTSLPVTEIALRTGFNSSSYFTKLFHRAAGKTPNAYRKEWTAREEPERP